MPNRKGSAEIPPGGEVGSDAGTILNDRKAFFFEEPIFLSNSVWSQHHVNKLAFVVRSSYPGTAGGGSRMMQSQQNMNYKHTKNSNKQSHLMSLMVLERRDTTSIMVDENGLVLPGERRRY